MFIPESFTDNSKPFSVREQQIRTDVEWIVELLYSRGGLYFVLIERVQFRAVLYSV